MKRFFIRFALLQILVVWLSTINSPLLYADLVAITGGSLSMSYDGDAFANQANVDPSNWGWLGLTPGQDLLRFGRAWSASETVGAAPTYSPKATTAFRPEAGTGPAPRQPNFRDNRAYMEATYPRVSPTVDFAVNNNIAVADSDGANRQITTLAFDTSDPLGSMTGELQSNGVAAWWFANDAIVDQDVAWVGFGSFNMIYDPTRVDYNGLGYSGWRFENQLGGTGGLFDTKNLTASFSGGIYTLTGDLYGNDDGTLGFYVGLAPDVKYGTFTLSGLTAVPEPSSFLILGATCAAGAIWRRRRASRSQSMN